MRKQQHLIAQCPAKMRAMRYFLPVFFSLFLCISAHAQWWQVQTGGTNTNLRGVSVAYKQNRKNAHASVVWAAGSNGVILKSIDEGKTWQRLHVAGRDALDFRGIVAFNDSTAYVMCSRDQENSL